MADIIRPPKFNQGPSGGGPEDPMLEARIARVEDALDKIKSALTEIKSDISHLPKQADYASLKADVARLDGRVSQLPTAWTMFTAIVTTVVATWGAGAAIVFALLRAARP